MFKVSLIRVSRVLFPLLLGTIYESNRDAQIFWKPVAVSVSSVVGLKILASASSNIVKGKWEVRFLKSGESVSKQGARCWHQGCDQNISYRYSAQNQSTHDHINIVFVCILMVLVTFEAYGWGSGMQRHPNWFADIYMYIELEHALVATCLILIYTVNNYTRHKTSHVNGIKQNEARGIERVQTKQSEWRRRIALFRIFIIEVHFRLHRTVPSQNCLPTCSTLHIARVWSYGAILNRVTFPSYEIDTALCTPRPQSQRHSPFYRHHSKNTSLSQTIRS